MSEKNITLNPEHIHNNPMNNSTSKMLYSFSKDKRFHKEDYLDVPFHTLPEIRNKRTTCMGFGAKTRFEDTRGVPSPDKYNVSREFDNHSKSGFSFGIGRDVNHQ